MCIERYVRNLGFALAAVVVVVGRRLPPSNICPSSTRWHAENVPAQGDRLYECPDLFVRRQCKFL